MSDFVPEEFDLEAAKYAHSTTDPSKRKRCPRCESTDLRNNTDDPRGSRNRRGRYYCRKCRTHIEKPVVWSGHDE